MGGMRQAVGDLDLHEGLTAYAKVCGFLVQCLDHAGKSTLTRLVFRLGRSAWGMSAKGITLPPSSKSFAFIGRYLNGLNPPSLKAVGFVFP